MNRLLGLLLLLPFALISGHWSINLKPGYFYFDDKDLRKIYHTGAYAVHLETNYEDSHSPFALWIDGGYLVKSGRSIGGHSPTKIQSASFTAGLKAFWRFNSTIFWYAGAGPRLFLLWVENDSPFVEKHTSNIGVGGGYVSGFWIFPTEHFFIDLFLDYSLRRFDRDNDSSASKTYDVHLDGPMAGIGLGLRY